MKRILVGMFFATVLGIGAGVGTWIVTKNPEIIIKAVLGAIICGFIFGTIKGEISDDK